VKRLTKNKNCQVYGAEINKSAVDNVITKGFYKKVLHLDLETLSSNLDLLKKSDFIKFDYILCADFLEHMKNINDIFLSLLKLVKKNGHMIVSLPNINHIDIVYNLVRGRFNYSLYGLLDNTHLKFFTKQSFLEWINIMSAENDLNMKADLLAQTKNYSVVEHDMAYKKKKMNKLLRRVKRIYKIAGNEDAHVLQNIFIISIG